MYTLTRMKRSCHRMEYPAISVAALFADSFNSSILIFVLENRLSSCQSKLRLPRAYLALLIHEQSVKISTYHSLTFSFRFQPEIYENVTELMVDIYSRILR